METSEGPREEEMWLGLQERQNLFAPFWTDYNGKREENRKPEWGRVAKVWDTECMDHCLDCGKWEEELNFRDAVQQAAAGFCSGQDARDEVGLCNGKVGGVVNSKWEGEVVKKENNRLICKCWAWGGIDTFWRRCHRDEWWLQGGRILPVERQIWELLILECRSYDTT